MDKLFIKKCIVLLLLFLISGCDVNYNITVSNDSVMESSNFYFDVSDINSNEYYDGKHNTSNLPKFIDSNYRQDYFAYIYSFNDLSKYSKSISSDNNGFNLKFNYDLEKFGGSNIFNACKKSNYTVDDKNIVIDVSDVSNCFYNDSYGSLNSIKINIKTDLKVLKNNADSVNKNIYTWNINRDNYRNKKIYIKIKKKIRYDNVFIGVGFLCIVILFMIFIIFIIKKKNLQNNSI